MLQIIENFLFIRNWLFTWVIVPKDKQSFKKGTVVKIDSFDIRETQKDLNIGLFGWYAICPSKELKKNKLYYFHSMMSLLFFIEMKIKTLDALKIFVHIEGPPFLEGH